MIAEQYNKRTDFISSLNKHGKRLDTIVVYIPRLIINYSFMDRVFSQIIFIFDILNIHIS